uniref:Phospholipase n=1 Tax=Solanum tuberosum TaxID=4113 RepID=M0ZS02_SOLTU
MGKRGRTRKDEAQKNTSVEGATPSQESQQQEAVASLRSGRVLRMKQEPKLDDGSALSPPPGFAPPDTSPSYPRYQTRMSLRALLGRCESNTVTPTSPIRHVKSSYPSCAICDSPAHLTTGISVATKEKVDGSTRTQLNHHSVLTSHGVMDVENRKSKQHTQTTPSFTEVVDEKNTIVSKADVMLNANATEQETKCDQSGALPTKGRVVESAHAGHKHQSVLTNRGVLDVEDQKPGQHTQTAPSFPEVVDEKNTTLRKTDVVSNANATKPETRSDPLPTKSMSLNFTRVAALVTDYSSYADKVESKPVMVDGYRVKEEAAPILQKIFLKYGDIAMKSSFSSVTFSSSLLEFVCDIYNKLEATDFLSITSTELQSMLAEVKDLESVKVDVGWLHRRLNDISQAKQLVQDSCILNEAKTRNLVAMETNKKELEGLKEELATLQERIHKKEVELGIAHYKNEKIMQRFADSKAKLNSYLKKSLVHDLL